MHLLLGRKGFDGIRLASSWARTRVRDREKPNVVFRSMEKVTSDNIASCSAFRLFVVNIVLP